MSVSRLVRIIGLVAVTSTIVIGFAGSSPRDAHAATVATIVSGGSTVEYLDTSNVWQPAVVVPANIAWATIVGTQWIDTTTTATSASPDPVTFRAPFTLPVGCISPSISIKVHADNWADFYLNGPVPVAPANFIGGQTHAALFGNFQGAPESFAAPPPNTFNNPGANFLYIEVGNAGGPPAPLDPRGLDFEAIVDCKQVILSTDVFECFQLNQGLDPNKPVMLDTDNFGKDVVTVRTSDLMCESALKFRFAAGTNVPPLADLPKPTIKELLQCFRLQKGQDPDDPAILDTRNFGPDKVRVRTSTRMCESALKLRPGLPPFGDVAQPMAWQCFNISDGQNPNAQVVLSTNNFGAHRAFVREAVMMCETAAKFVPTATGDIKEVIHKPDVRRVYQCFRLVETPNQVVPATLRTTNFGPDEVRIRRATLMCEEAKKTILIENPNPNEPIPDAAGSDDRDD